MFARLFAPHEVLKYFCMGLIIGINNAEKESNDFDMAFRLFVPMILFVLKMDRNIMHNSLALASGIFIGEQIAQLTGVRLLYGREGRLKMHSLDALENNSTRAFKR